MNSGLLHSRRWQDWLQPESELHLAVWQRLLDTAQMVPSFEYLMFAPPGLAQGELTHKYKGAAGSGPWHPSNLGADEKESGGQKACEWRGDQRTEGVWMKRREEDRRRANEEKKRRGQKACG